MKILQSKAARIIVGILVVLYCTFLLLGNAMGAYHTHRDIEMREIVPLLNIAREAQTGEDEFFFVSGCIRSAVAILGIIAGFGLILKRKWCPRTGTFWVSVVIISSLSLFAYKNFVLAESILEYVKQFKPDVEQVVLKPRAYLKLFLEFLVPILFGIVTFFQYRTRTELPGQLEDPASEVVGNI